MNLFQKLTLGTAGLLALGIGIAITFWPHGFYAGYGIELGSNPNFLSELRAPGANLAVLGAIIFAGALNRRMARLSAALGSTVFLAFAFGRGVSMVLDGIPEGGIVAALLVELVVGMLCLANLRQRAGNQGPRRCHWRDVARNANAAQTG